MSYVTINSTGGLYFIIDLIKHVRIYSTCFMLGSKALILALLINFKSLPYSPIFDVKAVLRIG